MDVIIVVKMPKLQKREYIKDTYKSISFSLTLPKEYIDKLKWKEQDQIIVRLTDDDKLLLEKA